MARRFRFAGLVSMFAVMLLATVFVVAACSDTDGSASIAAARAGDTMAAANGRGDDDPAANKGTGGNGEDAERSPDATHPAPGTAVGPLSQEEQTALLYLREEEKLAHDVYVTLYEKWGTRVFDNLSSSELRHMESMRSLLDSYGLADPVRNDTIGVFTDSELQALYDSLVAQGGCF